MCDPSKPLQYLYFKNIPQRSGLKSVCLKLSLDETIKCEKSNFRVACAFMRDKRAQNNQRWQCNASSRIHQWRWKLKLHDSAMNAMMDKPGISMEMLSAFSSLVWCISSTYQWKGVHLLFVPDSTHYLLTTTCSGTRGNWLTQGGTSIATGCLLVRTNALPMMACNGSQWNLIGQIQLIPSNGITSNRWEEVLAVDS